MDTLNGPVVNLDSLYGVDHPVVASTPSNRVSSNYKFYPTNEIISCLKDVGWHVRSISKTKTRIPGKSAFSKHIVRLRNNEITKKYSVGDNIPEMVVINSHDGTSSLQFMAGIYRLVCSNGLVVKSADFGNIIIPHRKVDFTEVIKAATSFSEIAEKSATRVEAWRKIILPDSHKMQFAKEAAQLRYKDDSHAAVVHPEWLLLPRRGADCKTDYWTTVNKVQENLIVGGTTFTDTNARRGYSTVRRVRGANRDLELNKGLWELAEKYAPLAA